jgi:hypothetical protein
LIEPGWGFDVHGMEIVLLCAACALAQATASAEPLGDPTRPSSAHSAVELSKQQHELRLEGIFRRDKRFIAIVDGRIVHGGERIANATIEEITADAVRYSRDGHEHTAHFARTTLQVRPLRAPQTRQP